jgi:hypothetical protein
MASVALHADPWWRTVSLVAWLQAWHGSFPTSCVSQCLLSSNGCRKLQTPVEVNLRPMVGQPACHGVGLPSGAHEQIFVCCLKFTGCLMWDSLSEERVGLSCFWALPEQSLSGPIAELSHMRLPHHGGQVPVFISRSKRVVQLYPRALCFPTPIVIFFIIYLLLFYNLLDT